eukprot:scaffold37718_cov60-Phaeocystis_antarctica.AAC.3
MPEGIALLICATIDGPSAACATGVKSGRCVASPAAGGALKQTLSMAQKLWGSMPASRASR